MIFLNFKLQNYLKKLRRIEKSGKKNSSKKRFFESDFKKIANSCLRKATQHPMNRSYDLRPKSSPLPDKADFQYDYPLPFPTSYHKHQFHDKVL